MEGDLKVTFPNFFKMNKEKELQNICFELITNSSTCFYGLFLSEVNKYFDTRIETACLAKHPDAKIPVMLFNPNFWSTLTKKQQKFLVLHEVDLASLYSNV